MSLLDKVFLGILVFVVLVIFVRVKKRGFFWRDKAGNELKFKQFFGRWKKGVQGITPVQQTKTTLWSFLPIFCGLLWGIVITFLSKTYWLTLVLVGSFPITTIQFVSNLQKYFALKRAADAVKSLELESNKGVKNGKNKNK